ncbi:MAG: GNAT family N-acetyltransferase [Bacteroidia bacterium]|nr:GNAT family N-acetyltransferase [Bacteroidia bacterium]
MTNLTEINIIKAASEHFSDVAKMHACGITEGFLTTLGTRFLAVLYRGISKANDSGVLVAIEQKKVLGFISYAMDIKTCYRQVLIAEWPAMAKALVGNAFNPSVYRKVIETLMYPFKRRESSSDSLASGAELLSMAVDQNARGKGIGKLLVAALDEEMSLMNIDGYQVVTHAVDERSNAFYLACGFTRITEFLNHGKPMRKYYKRVRR